MSFPLKHTIVECNYVLHAFATRVRQMPESFKIAFETGVGGIYVIAPGNDRTILGNAIKSKIGRADNFEERAQDYYYNTWINHRALGFMIPIATMAPTTAAGHEKSLQAEVFFQLLFWESIENKHVGDVGGRSTRGLRRDTPSLYAPVQAAAVSPAPGPAHATVRTAAAAAAAAASATASASMIDDDDPIEFTPQAPRPHFTAPAAAGPRKRTVSLRDTYPMGQSRNAPIRALAQPSSMAAAAAPLHAAQPSLSAVPACAAGGGSKEPHPPKRKRLLNLSAAAAALNMNSAAVQQEPAFIDEPQRSQIFE